MNRSRIVTLLAIIIAALLLSACGSGQSSASDAPRIVEEYLNALVNKDVDRLSALSCAEWEPTALIELDSFQAVEARLEGLACEQVGVDGSTALVVCQGKIIVTYNSENQELDLSLRTYQVINQGGENLVCGYQ